MPSFDGPNLLITLDVGVTSVDVEVDLYSDWKEFFKTGTNSRFPLAFRGSVAGDPLTTGLDLGGYFFFQNQLGWRIKPPEENATITFEGNLVAEDDTLPIFVTTDGTFTVLINGLQPQTQSVAIGPQILEGTRTWEQGMRLVLAGAAGLLSGAGGTTIIIRDAADTRNRIVATVDADGNRTAITLDDS